MMNKNIICIAVLALAACQTIPAQAPAAPAAPADMRYRASGTEPFWSLNIDGKRMVFALAGGNHVFGANAVSRPSFNGWRHVSKTISADVTFTPCNDGMSDRTYKDTVTVMVGNKSYKGCGGGVIAPKSLEQTHWRVVSINGTAIAPERKAMLSFEDGRMSGTIGCNRIGAPFTYKGNSLSFGPVMSTRMGCPNPIAQQEFAITNMLNAMKTTVFLDNGSVILTGQDGGTAELKQSH